MFLSVIGQIKGTISVRILEVREETGEYRTLTIDTGDANILSELYNIQQSGSSYCDFVVTKEEQNGVEYFELLHSSAKIINVDDTELETSTDYKTEEPNLMGLIRLLLVNNGSVVLDFDHNVTEIPEHMLASPTAIKYTQAFGMTVPYLYPNTSESEKGTFSWASETLVRSDRFDKFSDITKLRFVVPHDFPLGEYEYYLKENKDITVISDTRQTKYKCYSPAEAMEIFPIHDFDLVTPGVISRFKFAADSYSLALQTLKNTMHDDKEILASDSWGSGGSEPTGRFVKLEPNVKPNTRQATEMLQFFASTVKKDLSMDEIYNFTKDHPYYDPYKTIVSTYISIIAGRDQEAKAKLYRELKTQESLFNNILTCLNHQAIFFHDALLFNMWTANGFETDIPLYKIKLGGGGGTWQPPSTFY